VLPSTVAEFIERENLPLGNPALNLVYLSMRGAKEKKSMVK